MPFRFVNLPPLVAVLGGGQVAAVVAVVAISAGFCKEYARRRSAFLSILS